MDGNSHPILFFDGDCGLCSRSVRFLSRIDRERRLRFAPLQGETAKALLSEGLRASLSTVVYVPDTQTASDDPLLRSTAALQATIDTGSAWRIPAKVALCIPTSWRDAVYRFIANNRQRLFPKESCPLPSEDELSRILP